MSAGDTYLTEIREQPEALRRLLAHAGELEAVAGYLQERSQGVVRLVGHGSSNNAAAYGVYAFGLLADWAAVRASMSLAVYYGADRVFEQVPVIAVSQSGQTPDVVSYVERARERGAPTVALTNDEDSELGSAAELVVGLRAGREAAVAATKTYTNQLAALALVAGYLGGRGNEVVEALAGVAERTEAALPELQASAARLAVPFTFVGRMLVIGRGVEYATACEIALKLTETCRVAAEPMTTTALAHGPVAALDPLFPVWAIATADPVLPTVQAAVARVRETGAAIVASGSAAERLDGATYYLPTPASPLEVLSPLLSVLPGQLFSYGLALAKGFDPDRPEGLTKITRAP